MFLRNVESAINIGDLKRLTKRRLPRIIFDFIEGGLEDDMGLRTNDAAFENIRLVPRYYVDTSARSQQQTLFGQSYPSPFGVAPMGMAGFARPDADDCLAQAAAEAGIPYVLSGAGNLTIEAAAKLAPQTLWYQLYGARERSISLDKVKRAADSGAKALLMTCDVPAPSNRERNRRNGFGRPPRLPLGALIDVAFHPGWAMTWVRTGGVPMMGNWQRYAEAGASADDVAGFMAKQTPDPSQTWRDVEAIRKVWTGPLLVKGILHPKDAVLAREAGADGVVVSNHGARQLDAAPSPLEVLPLIRSAVGPDFPLVFDGAIQRGWHIIAALCAGADFVMVGRSMLYGAAAGGLPGARKSIAILRREVDAIMTQIGAGTIGDLGPDRLFRNGAFL